MKIVKLILSAMVLLSGSAAMAQQIQMPNLPVDTAVRIGKLPNGLIYYIRHNDYPAHRANFYIAQRVGSIQENDKQRGLAHFLEHMCFNGTKHYPDDKVIRYLETLGVQFGSNLNAFTSIDKTVYRICNVPTKRVSALDSCMLVLRDWSCGLILDPKEIDKERGVIHEEWRMRTNATTRMLERNLPDLYPGSKYGLRMPIGKMEIVDNFKPKELRDYYEKWYRPDNQGIIIIGDVDVNRTEAKIKEMFGNIALQKNAAQVIEEPVPDNAQPIIIVDKDKEQQFGMVELMFKHDAVPDSMKSNMSYLVYSYINDVVCSMLNQRLSELAQTPDCPYAMAECNNSKYIFAKTKDAFDVSAMPKDGQTEKSLASLMRETMRARQFGFTATEYDRAKADYLSKMEKNYTNRNKRENSVFGDMYRDHFLDNEPIMSMESLYMMVSQIVPNIPVSVVNDYMKLWVSASDSNIVVLNFNNEKDSAVYPTKENLQKALDEVRGEKLSAYVDNVKNEPLIKVMPKKGKIKKETVNSVLGYKELKLSNGATVILKQTDFKDDEVKMTAKSFGGSSLYGENEFANVQMFDDVIGVSGLGDFGNTELTKALAGKQANVNLSLSISTQTANGSCTPKDMTTMFQMAYLYFTNIKRDDASYQTLMKQMELVLKNKSLSPEQAFSDSLKYTRFNRNPRYAPMTVNDLKNVSYDRILQIAKERFGNASNFTFTFCGNFNEDSIKPLIEEYIASLPAKGKKETFKDVTTMPKGVLVNNFTRQMETPKAMAYVLWHTEDAAYTLDNSVKADAVGQILDMLYLKKIREEASAAYSAGAYGFVQHVGSHVVITILGGCPMKPEKSDTAIYIMHNEINNVAASVDPSMLQKVKAFMLKKADEDAKSNDHWINVIDNYRNYAVDMQTGYKKVVEALTPESISTFIKDVVLKSGNRTDVIMLPQK
jgi:zinc protease